MAAQTQMEQLGLPAGIKFYSCFPFGSLNQKDARVAIEDSELFWVENFIRQGKGKFRTLWDRGKSIYTTPPGLTIVEHFWFNIGPTQYAAVFLSNGTAVQVTVATAAVTTISAVLGTFYVPGGPLPACCQSGAQYLLISNNNTSNDYWIWDGSIFYSAGSIGPDVTISDGGSGYSSTPTVTVYGGSGSGVVLTPTISGGSVVALTVANPGSGYQPGDSVQVAFSGGGSQDSPILQAVLGAQSVAAINVTVAGSGYTSAPGVTISGGGGSGATAFATISGGQVSGVTIINPGSGYTSTPSVAFSGGGGTGAAALAQVAAGGVASVTIVDGGTGLEGTPQLTVIGGGGSGAMAVATVSGGAITGVTVTNSGSGYTTVPAVVVQAGLNQSAAATIELMPYGVSGSSMETYASRLWLQYPHNVGPVQNGGVLIVSAPESLTDFATSDGGLLDTSTDRFLKAQYTAIRQSNGYLYPVGDSSVSVISNVQTGGSPTTTTFNYQNADPQTGTSWRDSVQDYGRSFLFANALGIWGVYGGSATKISDKINDIFDNAVLPPNAAALTPSSAVASIYNLKTYLLLITITDPFTGLPRNVMLAWDETDWFVVSQSAALTYIATQEVNSDLTAWGTDGTDLFPLLNTPSATLQKTVATKLYGGSTPQITKQGWGVWVQGEDKSADQVGIVAVGSLDTEDASYPNGYPLPNGLVWPANNDQGASMAVARTPSLDVPGSQLGVTLTSTSPDFYLSNIVLGYVEVSALF